MLFFRYALLSIMKKVFVICITLFVLQSCKDNDGDTRPSLPSFKLVSSVGSYWLYEWYYIDTIGNEKYLRTDSIYIAGDTTINGNTYIVMKGNGFNNNEVNYQRDSLGFVINSKGDILWDKSSTGIFRRLEESEISLEWSITSLSSDIEVPAGKFRTIERTTKACYNSGQPLTHCDTCQKERAYFSEGLGVVFERTAYIVNNDCSYLEGRLIRYLIK